jgi:hypothetical protein
MYISLFQNHYKIVCNTDVAKSNILWCALLTRDAAQLTREDVILVTCVCFSNIYYGESIVTPTYALCKLCRELDNNILQLPRYLSQICTFDVCLP